MKSNAEIEKAANEYFEKRMARILPTKSKVELILTSVAFPHLAIFGLWKVWKTELWLSSWLAENLSAVHDERVSDFVETK